MDCAEGEGEVSVVFAASSGEVDTTARRAASKAGGKIRFRRAARRRIPAQARGESQNFGATSGSRISRNEESENAGSHLGESEVSSIQSCPRAIVPELIQRNENGEEA